MLKKLIKYDLRSMAKVFIPLWSVAPVIALLFGLTLRGVSSQFQHSPFYEIWVHGAGILSLLLGTLFVCMMVALFVVTLLFIIQRFWKGLLKEEGYLMFTLPVKTWQLITAKGISATLVSCVSGMVGILSFVIMTLVIAGEVFDDLVLMWRRALELLTEQNASFWMFVVLWTLLMLFGLVANIYQIYASMALGQLFTGHRVAGAIASYVGINLILTLVSGVLMMVFAIFSPEALNLWLLSQDGGFFGWCYLVFLLGTCILQIVLFHLIADWVLSRKLNLE